MASPGVQPHPGIKIGPPAVPPAPGQVITAWQIVQPEVGCCKCDTLTTCGWVWVICLVLLVSPLLAWIPCLCEGCHEQRQIPVYGGAAGGQAPMAMPVAQQATV